MWNRILTSPAERVIRGPPRGDNQSWNDGPKTPPDSAKIAAKPPLTWKDLVSGAVGARHVTPTTYRPAAETGTVNAPRDGFSHSGRPVLIMNTCQTRGREPHR
ncbi:hypothetical protein ATKI12_1572 [Kitasatospora sp. Ki12]